MGRHPVRLAGVCLVLAGILLGQAAQTVEPDLGAFHQEYRRVYDGLRKPNCGEFIDTGVVLAESALFATQVGKSARFGFLSALNDCAFDYGRREAVLRAADIWAGIAPREWRAQVVRLGYGVEFGRPMSTLEAFDFFVTKDRDFIQRVPLPAVQNALLAADQVDGSGDRKLAVLEALARIRYRPPAPYNDDLIRFAHARLLLARGEASRAESLLEPVTGIHLVAQMRVDRLFEPLRANAAFNDRLDMSTAIERELARTRAVMTARPELITAVVQHVDALATAARYEEALALADHALGRNAEDPRTYVDGYVHERLLLQSRAAVLAKLGRAEDAVIGFLEAANKHEYRRPNVSQMLALGLYLVDLGRGAQAMPLLPLITGTSRREQAWLEAIRSCAGVQLSRETDRSHGLAYLRANENDEPTALTRALLCSGDLDGAAELMIRRLGSQGTSGAALMALQRRPPLRSDEAPYRSLLLDRLATLRARPDVLAAVLAVGRVEELPFDINVDF